MAKILKIEGYKIIVGMEDGTTVEIPKTQFSFEIHEFMKIDIYKHNDKYKISKSKNQTSFNPQEDEPPMEGKIYVDKITYGLLRLFLGTFAVDHFYAGNRKKAILTLCVSVLPLALGIAFLLEDQTGNLRYYPRMLFVGFVTISILVFIAFNIDPFIQKDKPPMEGKIYVDKIKYGLLRLLVIDFLLAIAISIINYYTGNSRGDAVLFSAVFYAISLIVFIAFYIYLFITAIAILCKTPTKNGNILI